MMHFSVMATRTPSFSGQPTARLQTPPGQAWGYSSRGYQILSRIVGDSIGGGPQGVSDFAANEIFGPLGMHSVTIHFDQAGTMMGAWSVLASPRDWARFGLLYLNDGMIGTRRILPGGWVRFSTTPTLKSTVSKPPVMASPPACTRRRSPGVGRACCTATALIS